MKNGVLFAIRYAVALLLLVSAAGGGNAQGLYGSLTGNLVDPSSAAVVGTKVEASNTDTGVVRQAVTDERGAYLFSNLPAGTYKVTFTAKAFKTVVADNVRVNANEVRRVDMGLQIATASEIVEVNAASVILQTDKADVGADISAQEVVELPYTGGEGKNFQSLLYLVPGAAAPAARAGNSEAGNPQRAQTLLMNGVSSTSNSTKI